MSIYDRVYALKDRNGALITFPIKDIVGIETGDLQTAIANALDRGDVLTFHYDADDQTCYIGAVEDEEEA